MPVLRIGHTPDADDAFMYYAIAHGKVPVGEYQIQHVLEDIQTLNQRALVGELEGTAISTGAYPMVVDKYRIMRVGSSIGRNYGPMVVALTEREGLQLKGSRIAIPGEYTTAYLLLRLYAEGFDAVPMAFDSIVSAVQKKEVDAGLLIHEGQITYGSLGLAKVLDLGEAWGQDTGLPIPLGLDMVRRDLGQSVATLMADSLRESILFAFEHEDEALEYAMQFSRGTDKETCRRFVRMYVNDDTMDMGKEGQQALETLFSKAKERGIIDDLPPIDLI
ncbi:MAG: ABC transporter substrate-binding protein [Dehalococcoidia bacterium]|jgi:1,4-dihydroxy-6-naphthoate synthase|nr:ABC transporter substrate-binding protein [Dehalococcoidia bacterium]